MNVAFLIDDLVFWIGKKVSDMADEELYGNKEKIHEQLVSLQAKLDMGEITEEEYNRREKEFLERLTALQEKEEEDNENK